MVSVRQVGYYDLTNEPCHHSVRYFKLNFKRLASKMLRYSPHQGWSETMARKKAAKSSETAGKPKLLAGGNPQIAKGDGDLPVQAYIAAMPGWKGDVGRRLDELIVRTVPSVRKAVRWNSPFYGIAGQGWFLSYHCLTRYIKVAFFSGSSLRPLPPVESKSEGTRYFHIQEGDQIDEELLANWIRQAAELPGWTGFDC